MSTIKSIPGNHMIKTLFQIADMHCDMLAYLADIENAHPFNKNDIGCAIPYLINGKVKLQVMAAYSGIEQGSACKMQRQVELFQKLLKSHEDIFMKVSSVEDLKSIFTSDKIGIILSIENASGLCEQDESLEKAFIRLDELTENDSRILYISFTHHGENRFGGGNYSKAGLKDDGRALLDYLNRKKIAVDLSHTSDALAYGIFNYVDSNRLEIPIIASHSNFRFVHKHTRNLPDELAKEIINRKGLIGMNFLRDFVNPENPETLIEHILHGFHLGSENVICFGADFFFTKSAPDKSRIPFFFKEHENAEKYQDLLLSLNNILEKDKLTDLAHQNVINFIHRLWNEQD
jgi:microsomal dipeptidase-like Zn-dependent dipeptidase